MKIADVATVQLRTRAVENICDGTQDVLIVRVTTDEGIAGLGEVVSASYVARAVIEAPRSGAGRHGLREIVRGLDPLDPETVWDAMREGTSWYGRSGVVRHAMAGIDMALWDIRGKVAGQPLYRLLGGDRVARRIGAYASVLWGDTIEDTARLAEGFTRAGFLAVKFGFGPIGASLECDVAMVRAARRALGDRRQLMVDVGRRWDVSNAIERCAALAPFRLSWIEEPLRPDDLAGYAKLTAAVELPIAAAETEDTIEGFKAFLDAGVRVIQPDLGRVGLTQALKIGSLARSRGARCVPHCFGTGVNTTASIHWMAATGGELVEYPMGENPLCRDLAIGLPRVAQGFVTPTEAAGLGVELDHAVVGAHRVA